MFPQRNCPKGRNCPQCYTPALGLERPGVVTAAFPVLGLGRGKAGLHCRLSRSVLVMLSLKALTQNRRVPWHAGAGASSSSASSVFKFKGIVEPAFRCWVQWMTDSCLWVLPNYFPFWYWSLPSTVPIIIILLYLSCKYIIYIIML